MEGWKKKKNFEKSLHYFLLSTHAEMDATHKMQPSFEKGFFFPFYFLRSIGMRSWSFSGKVWDYECVSPCFQHRNEVINNALETSESLNVGKSQLVWFIVEIADLCREVTTTACQTVTHARTQTCLGGTRGIISEALPLPMFLRNSLYVSMVQL